jgi:aminoglycoside/choline kinase family phosphotransferase
MAETLALSHRTAAIEAFLAAAGWGAADRRPLAADASFRRYDRLRLGPQSAVLMDAPPPVEDVRPFLRIARHLLARGYSAPAILAEDADAGLLLLEDLGDATYTRLLAAGQPEAPLYQLAVALLIDLGRRPAPQGLPAYDPMMLLREACLLTEWYAPAVGVGLSEQALAAYRTAWQAVLPVAYGVPHGLVLRDYHVDNLMRLADRPGLAQCGLLDFQDAVIGPITYDLISLLEDARRDVDPAVIATERQRFLAAHAGLDPAAFDASCACLAVQRHAKVIGIFTRLDRRDGKSGYLRHIERLWRLLPVGLAHPALAPLAAWFAEYLPPAARRTPLPGARR